MTNDTKRTYSIYGLIDPRTNTVFYVGKALKTKTRLTQHKKNYRVSTPRARYSIIGEILQLGLPLEMCIIDTVTTDNPAIAFDVERCWILLYKAKGEAVANKDMVYSRPEHINTEYETNRLAELKRATMD